MSTWIEKDCTIEHEGQKYEAGGAVVTPDAIIAYPSKDGVLRDWHGHEVGTWRIVSSWPVESVWGSTLHQIEATVDGVVYTGRGFGEGMIYRGKRKAGQPPTCDEWVERGFDA